MKYWHSEIILSRGGSGIAITGLVCGNRFVWMCARARIRVWMCARVHVCTRVQVRVRIVVCTLL